MKTRDDLPAPVERVTPAPGHQPEGPSPPRSGTVDWPDRLPWTAAPDRPAPPRPPPGPPRLRARYLLSSEDAAAPEVHSGDAPARLPSPAPVHLRRTFHGPPRPGSARHPFDSVSHPLRV